MTSDSLFLLVNSMTKEEKRSFKLNIAKYEINGARQYLLLFDILEKQQVYDEKAILKKLKKDIPSFKNLRHLKTYLYEQILDSLKRLHKDDSSRIKLNNYLTEIELLCEKELFRDCLNCIKKAKEFARKYEDVTYVLKVIEWEIKVVNLVNDAKQTSLLKQRIHAEVKEAINIYTEITELREAYLDSHDLLRTLGQARIKENSIEKSNVLFSPLINTPAQSFQGELYRLMVKTEHAQFAMSLKEVSAEIENIIELYHSNPQHIDERINTYFNNMISCIPAYMMAEKYKMAAQHLQKLKAICHKRQDKLSASNKIILLTLEAFMELSSGEFGRALKFIPEMEKLIKANHKKLDPVEELFFCYFCFSVYFANKDFKNAQYYIQQVLNRDFSVRLDMQSSARIFNLILQYEQQEYEYLGYALRSTYRFLKKKEMLHEPERIILDFLVKAVKLTSEKQMLQALAEFKGQMLLHKGEPLPEFPLNEWIDSKLQKRELADIMKEKYAKAIVKEEAGTDVLGN